MTEQHSADKDARGWTHEEARAHTLTERLLERCAAYGVTVCGDRPDLLHCDWCERCLAAEALTLNANVLWEEVKAVTLRAVNAAYGTDPRHGLIARAVADTVAFGKPLPWRLAEHFGRVTASDETLGEWYDDHDAITGEPIASGVSE